jgi:predicted AlkP superfamily pyrophosphatase or phosphodiesterase
MIFFRLLLLLVLIPTGWAAEPVPNAVLISCDGVGRDILTELLDAGKLPALAAIIQEGSLQKIEVVGHRTSTVPSHATMLTGYLPAVHGLRNNQEIKPIREGLTIFERLKQQLGLANIHTFMVTGKAINLGGATTNDVYGLVRKNFDYFDAQDRLAAAVVQTALPVWAKMKTPRFFVFLHFPDPDRAGHLFGKDSPEHRAGVVQCDAAIAQVVTWLQTEKLAATTRLYITTDHGFDNHSSMHNNAPHIFLATNDKAVTRGGQLADIPATILQRFGVNTTSLAPPLAGKSLAE